MEISPIKSERDYDLALKEVDALFAAVPGSPEGDRLEILLALGNAYEAKRWRIEPADPITTIKWV